jgi:hypothetical protein
MNKRDAGKRARWLWAALLGAAFALPGKASALPPETSAYLNIEVTISATLSVTVDNVASSSYTTNWSGTPNQALASASTATVTNNSTALSEGWALSTWGTTLDISGGGSQETWANANSTSSVGTNAFGVQAVFGSSATASGGCPGAAAADWATGTLAPPLTTSAVSYTATTFADGANATMNKDQSGVSNAVNAEPDDTVKNLLFVNGKRALCWRAIMPSSTYTTHKQEIQIVVTAVPAS